TAHRRSPHAATQGDAETVPDPLQPPLRERPSGARPCGLASESSGAQVAIALLTRREVEERLPFLRHDRDERSHAFRFTDDVEAESMNPPGRRDQQGGGDSQERRLARAVPAEEGHSLPATDGEGHAPVRLYARPISAAVHLPDVPRQEGFLGHGPVQAKSAYKARFRVRS